MGTPELSVVMAARDPGPVLSACLEALTSQVTGSAEVLIADCSRDGSADVARRFPGVRLLRFETPRGIPFLRGAAMASARGPVIAVLDPYCLVGAGWVRGILKWHAERPEAAIGGPVALEYAAGESLVRWAVYASEYAAFIPPLPEGPVRELPGGNVAYKRAALGDVAVFGRGGFWKAAMHQRIRRDGAGLWMAPDLLVTLRKEIPLGEFARSRYHHGRCFAGTRISGASRLARAARALSAPGVPPLNLYRDARRLWRNRARRGQGARALPLLAMFHMIWAWGELWGYLAGPGRSCAELAY